MSNEEHMPSPETPFEEGSYAQWVRGALAIARAHKGNAVSLFESSVPEPRELLRNTVIEAVEPGFSHYYVSAFGDGNPFVREMLAERYSVGREQVLCTTGATGGLSLIYRAFVRPSDHVLIETPGFDLFGYLAEASGATVGHFHRSGARFAIDVAEVEARLRPNTRLVVLSDLHNPSGMVVPQPVLRALAELAERRGFLLVVDEVYGDYASTEQRPGAAAALSPAVISLSSLTKIYGLGVLRCGWIVGAPRVIDTLRHLNGRIEFGISTLSHAIAAHVMANASLFEQHSRSYVERCRPRFQAWFEGMVAEGLMGGDLPDDGCICFPSLPGIADSRAFSEWLIARSGVIVAPGEYFGAPGHVRIGFCQEDDKLETGLRGLEDGLRSYAREPQAIGST
ncbi:pyridoxal phosphate-dependent aminotransferase [Sphingomonas lycopersici]|uniref:Pyridoxal phosphate-dependent aminotransferase n=1 Tax=Sphingomonas lycopersici TaxID=2951807 RepID=A0AA41Z9F5_9SPHN|nr:pyridoxal phosphate-dependent aminotransferase [Sphingomonas lycopersici]MCW6535930.1 pyridoxal phosphate-dependent aminotransferase [Sphingomonas lycopersici]